MYVVMECLFNNLSRILLKIFHVNLQNEELINSIALLCVLCVCVCVHIIIMLKGP